MSRLRLKSVWIGHCFRCRYSFVTDRGTEFSLLFPNLYLSLSLSFLSHFSLFSLPSSTPLPPLSPPLLSPSRHIQLFWRALEEMSVAEQSQLINFCSGRSRLPASAADFPMSFKLTAPPPRSKARPDDYLPIAQTCFFSLSIPEYTNIEVYILIIIIVNDYYYDCNIFEYLQFYDNFHSPFLFIFCVLISVDLNIIIYQYLIWTSFSNLVLSVLGL
jgi:HECT-domain (ubiquitin-transferase)